MRSGKRPLVVGIGGTTRSGSSSERALRLALQHAEGLGAEIRAFVGPHIVLPMYAPERPDRSREAQELVAALRDADGVILSSPGYHGSLSGLLKNALDYTEDMREDPLPYFEGRAVGLIACAFGWQATGSTLAAMRSIVHALRGWPTPLGVAINSSDGAFDSADGRNTAVVSQLNIMARQVVEFAQMRASSELGQTEAVGALS
jgi:FMN reductase